MILEKAVAYSHQWWVLSFPLDAGQMCLNLVNWRLLQVNTPKNIDTLENQLTPKFVRYEKKIPILIVPQMKCFRFGSKSIGNGITKNKKIKKGLE